MRRSKKEARKSLAFNIISLALQDNGQSAAESSRALNLALQWMNLDARIVHMVVGGTSDKQIIGQDKDTAREFFTEVYRSYPSNTCTIEAEIRQVEWLLDKYRKPRERWWTKYFRRHQKAPIAVSVG